MSRFCFRPAPLTLAIAMAVAAIPAMAQSLGAVSASPQVEVNIPAQPMAQALDALARQARVELMVQPSLVAGKLAPAVAGQLTAREALNRLLAGSGLTADIEGTSVTIQRARSGAAEPATLAPVTVSANTERSAVTEHTGSYAARAVTVGKGEQALKDIPQSISVVTRQLMDEQKLTSIYDVLASTTGITIQQSPQGGKYIYSRGFDLTTMQYDGVPLNRGMYGRANNFTAGTAFYDRVEVLRGAAGLLQGSGNPGGAVNLVRKRPLDTAVTSVDLRAGSWDRYGAQVDSSGILNAEGTLRGRAVLDHSDEHSFIDYVNQRSTTLYGTLEYDLSPSTQLNVALSSEELTGRPSMNGLPRFSDGTDLGLPRSTYFGATWNRRDTTNRGLYADLSHSFNEDWKFKVSVAHVLEKHDLKYLGSNRAVSPILRQGAVLATRSTSDIETSGIDANLTGKFEAFGRRHELVSGMNYSRASNDTVYGFRTNYNVFDIYNYNPNLREPSDDEIYASNREAKLGVSRQFGVYNALRLQLTDPLKLIVGARVSWFNTDWTTNTTGISPSRSVTESKENAKLSPYAGLVYAINPQWSAYASYADIFRPQTEQNEAGQLLKPVVGANYEAGLKGELMDGRLNTSFAVFSIDQKNRAQEDFNTSPTCRNDYYCYTDTGEVRSQGFDAEISGEVAPRWNLFAGYTFNHTKYLKDVSSEGQSFNTYTPKHMLRVWSTYQLSGALQDLTLGGGVSAQSYSYRQLNGVTARMSGRAVWNAFAKYQINRNWSATMNLNNVFNKTYYSSLANFVNSNYYGDPRNVMLTVRGTF
ncbi:TonB-dependent siderophore receptor [Pigmentiphaga aceris]|uniref:TonB-dependent siderophore receptor n=1 Tax=Pigmentiphaga aceris TaxID=1940612 RepID=A0A5C0AUF5_9BURK|nr:TonB-dependent siderophore receptor [Pigmentiphaga aceris]QEI05304.1 TonB-dependent siderophore receptor [Pigmentiphaga aceris]